MRMPPGKDGVWAATQIRELDPAIEIVICTAYSDADPSEIGGMVPPEDKLSYLQKPFHPHEVRQMTIALASKWRAERRIVRLAYFDTLTGLPNREQSRNRLAGALQAAKENVRTSGRAVPGSGQLQARQRHPRPRGGRSSCCASSRTACAARCVMGPTRRAAAGACRPGDIARLGGDEFLVLLPHLRTTVDAGSVAERLILALREPIQLGSNSLVVTPSVGIALYPQDGSDAETLLRNADLAMYFAKRRNPGTFAFFDVSMNATALHRFTIEEQLRGALDRNEFSLEYQPQFDVRTGGISGMEALLRWTNAELGAVSPAEFIPVAEETGLILRHRRVGAAQRLPAGPGLARRGPARTGAWRSTSPGRQFALAEYPREVADDSARRPASARDAGARDHRVGGHGG